MIYFWHVNLSVAVAVGFIALFGLAVETGIVDGDLLKRCHAATRCKKETVKTVLQRRSA